jgi:anti-sigma regulatory factor (Ser/Thr protein kinase)
MTDTEIDTVLELPATTSAPALARSYVAERVPSEIVDDVLLLVSELVTNAVRHGGARIRLHALRTAAAVRIGVHDDGDDLPKMPADAGDPTATGGRGLLVVSLLAHRWGVDPADPPPGKTVWVEFFLAAAVSADGQASAAGG